MSTAGTATINRSFTYKHGDRPLEGYTIQRAAGRGGFGEVYYALSDGGREVALKLVQTYEQIELRGISHCMNLKSPHLVTIFDVKHGADGRPWVIMEFVAGPSLRELIDAAPSGLGVQKSAFFLREIAKGLTYLHECGIVHRDLKPGNIFYENGYVKIGDYGLAKAISTSQYSGQTVTVGTVHYMAPEIGEGRYDKSIDIYALGILLFEMLTGQVPFFGASPTEVLMKHLSNQVDTTAVEEPFATVIRKAMAKNPAERYQTVQEMVEAVFGAEHVRNSVSHFSPESLTMVAGQVARKLPGNSSFSNSSGAAGGEAEADTPWGRFGKNMEMAANRFGQALGGGRQPYQQQYQGQTSSAEGKADAADAVSPAQRRALAAVAIAVIAIGTGVAANDRPHAPVVQTLFAALAILGTTFGVRLGMRRILPGLPPEPRILRKLAIGGCAGAIATFFSLPIALMGEREIPGVGGTWLALLISVFVLDWKKRTAADRPSRVSFPGMIGAVIVGGVVGAMTGSSPVLIAGIIGGASLAVEIASAWRPGTPSRAAAAPQGYRPFPPFRPFSPFSPAMAAPATPVPVMAAAPAVQPVPAANQPAPPSPASAGRPLRRGGRIALLIFFVALSTLGLFLWAMLAAQVPGNSEEAATMFGFGLVALVGAAFCLRRSFARTFTSRWQFLVRPMLQIACAGTAIVSVSLLTIGHIDRRDAPPAIFFTIFPALVFLVITFFVPSGDRMSQAILTAPLRAAPDGESGGFPLGRLIAGAGRFAFTMIALALLAVSLIAALAVVADLPGLFNSHLVPTEVHDEMRQTFGRADWPRLMRAVGSIGSFIVAVIAVAILMQTRRRFGAVHMMRAVFGAGLLFLAVQILGHALPAWADLVQTDNGWEFLDQYIQHITSHRLASAAIPAGVGIILLFWPGERRRTPRFAAVQEEVMR